MTHHDYRLVLSLVLKHNMGNESYCYMLHVPRLSCLIRDVVLLGWVSWMLVLMHLIGPCLVILR